MTAPVPAALARLARILVSRPALLTLGFGLVYLATYDSDMGSPDEHQRYRLALELARNGWHALEGSGSLSKYPPLQSLFGGVLMKLGLLLDAGQDGPWTHRFGLGVSLLACIALIPLFYSLARSLDVPGRAAAVATVLFGLTNPVWPYSKRFFSEPLTAALALGAFVGASWFLRSGRRLPLFGGLVCLALLPLNNMVVPVALGMGLGLMLLVARRFWALGALAAATAVSSGLFFGSLWLRYGGVRTAGYGNERFTFGTLEGLHGLLFGWGRSIFVFAPLLVLSLFGVRALWRRSKPVALGIGATLATALLVVASWWCSWGGISWGPRLLHPVLPIACVGAAAVLTEFRRWKAALAVPVLCAGLYVQLMGVAFKHDFDIYFWMQSFEDERSSWFRFDKSVVSRMPRHFREHPWDLSSAFLTLEQTGPSVVEMGKRPARAVEIVHRGDALIYHWTIADIFAVLEEGGGVRRVPAAELGARLVTFNGRDGSGALDGNPATRWDTQRKRLDGNWVRLELGSLRGDLVRLELEHMPSDRDFPNGLSARVDTGNGWVEVPARAATPRLVWNPLIAILAAAGLGCVLAGLRREPKLASAPKVEAPAPAPVL